MDNPIIAYILVVVCVFGSAIQSPLKKWYQAKSSRGIFFFLAMMTFTAACVSGVGSLVEGVSYEIGVLPYSIACAVCYAVCMLFAYLALACGPLALTALIVSYSLILPTVYGLLFFDNPLYLSQVVGFAVLLVSLYLVNMAKEKEAAEQIEAVETTEKSAKIPAKWYLYSALLFVANGGVAVAQQAVGLVLAFGHV